MVEPGVPSNILTAPIATSAKDEGVQTTQTRGTLTHLAVPLLQGHPTVREKQIGPFQLWEKGCGELL